MSKWNGRIVAFVIGAIVVVAAVVVGIVVLKRVETGAWELPSRGDFVRIRNRIARREAKPSRTIFLERAAIELAAGYDDAPHGVSSVVGSGSQTRVTTPGFTGSKSTWRSIVRCVRQKFEPFDVVVTDKRPASNDYLMAVVGGTAQDIGVSAKHVGGLAPFHGGVIPKAVVFAFSKRLGNRSQATCETISMEIAHAYGLDHQYYCPDLMTYLHGCGKKKFTDHDSPCGEGEPRECEGGKPTQNSFQRLFGLLGPKRAPTAEQKR